MTNDADKSLEAKVKKNVEETLKQTRHNYDALLINQQAIENLHRQASNLNVRLVSFGRSCGKTRRKMKYKCYKTMAYIVLVIVVMLIMLGLCSKY